MNKKITAAIVVVVAAVLLAAVALSGLNLNCELTGHLGQDRCAERAGKW